MCPGPLTFPAQPHLQISQVAEIFHAADPVAVQVELSQLDKL